LPSKGFGIFLVHVLEDENLSCTGNFLLDREVSRLPITGSFIPVAA